MLDIVLDWLTGDLSNEERVWTALAPAIIFSSYSFGGLIIYMIRYVLAGPYRDREMEARGESFLATLYIRRYFTWAIRPLWGLVLRSGVPPMAITTLSVLLALASGVSFAAGRFALGGWLYIFSGICDLLDGRLARARGEVTRVGGALDSILDRYADAAVLVGLAYYYRDNWVLVPTLLALVGSGLVPYIRARGEASGVDVKVGLMQRAERILYLGVACAMSPVLEVFLAPNDPKPLHRIGVMGIVLLAVATQTTALHRLFVVISRLSDRPSTTWLKENSRPITRNLIAAFVATLLDFALVNLLVGLSFIGPALATAIGCIFGGAINFTINRIWTFGSTDAKLPQMGRYTFVSFTSALLNSGGVAVLLMLPAIHYRIAWIVVRLAVFLAWNFPLHRDYVFANGEAKQVRPARA
jgi:phosphatidylglycerophosphate synthase/putative flippase GtrA